ncbi:MAG: YicC family protein [Gammaproteobacteria bacterium]|nr:YicC family protein [Gammaproteobacteria bacterium]
MTDSMTAFARAETDTDLVSLYWEIRSVNHRYLDCSIKTPEAFRRLESELVAQVKTRLQRGKVDCQLRITQSPLVSQQMRIDTRALASLAALLTAVKDQIPDASPPGTLDLLKWPGVLEETSQQEDMLMDIVKEAFQRCLHELVEMRQKEGNKLATVVLEQLRLLDEHRNRLLEQVPAINAQLKSRLIKRLDEITTQVDQARLEQELVYLVQKADIQEELDRLASHIEEIRATFQHEKPIGRRLDFLMQELNREANTIASKSVTAQSTQHAVEMKVLIEQMREQIQNLE